jgi:hypothetical protein
VHYYILRHAPWKHRVLGEKGLLLSCSPGAYIILSTQCAQQTPEIATRDFPAAENRTSPRFSVEAVRLWFMPRISGKQSSQAAYMRSALSSPPFRFPVNFIL